MHYVLLHTVCPPRKNGPYVAASVRLTRETPAYETFDFIAPNIRPLKYRPRNGTFLTGRVFMRLIAVVLGHRSGEVATRSAAPISPSR